MRDGFENVLTTSSRVCSRGLGRSAALQILAIATAMSVVCALQPIPIRIPHPSRADREHVLNKKRAIGAVNTIKISINALIQWCGLRNMLFIFSIP